MPVPRSGWSHKSHPERKHQTKRICDSEATFCSVTNACAVLIPLQRAGTGTTKDPPNTFTISRQRKGFTSTTGLGLKREIRPLFCLHVGPHRSYPRRIAICALLESLPLVNEGNLILHRGHPPTFMALENFSFLLKTNFSLLYCHIYYSNLIKTCRVCINDPLYRICHS